MRLLKFNGSGGFSLTSFSDNNLPDYAVLSHTWGDDGTEVTFKDIQDYTGNNKEGFRKLLFCGNRAQADDLECFWVDTCCIDKSNNNEVVKSINSMFRWYKNAAKCYVYLSDVSGNALECLSQNDTGKSAFRRSRWFTRGWTLQDLLAPTVVEFYTQDGELIGDKKSLECQIHEATGIAIEVLQGCPLAEFSVDDRLLWARKRQTTEVEDKAYCLLGIFDIYMPLIYGEGEAHAMKRLLKEINESMTPKSEERKSN